MRTGKLHAWRMEMHRRIYPESLFQEECEAAGRVGTGMLSDEGKEPEIER